MYHAPLPPLAVQRGLIRRSGTAARLVGWYSKIPQGQGARVGGLPSRGNLVWEKCKSSRANFKNLKFSEFTTRSKHTVKSRTHSAPRACALTLHRRRRRHCLRLYSWAHAHASHRAPPRPRTAPRSAQCPLAASPASPAPDQQPGRLSGCLPRPRPALCTPVACARAQRRARSQSLSPEPE